MQTIECDVLFLTDSNLHKMKPEIMDHGLISQKIFRPTFKDIEHVISQSNIKQTPSIVCIQRTTDIEKVNFNLESGHATWKYYK